MQSGKETALFVGRSKPNTGENVVDKASYLCSKCAARLRNSWRSRRTKATLLEGRQNYGGNGFENVLHSKKDLNVYSRYVIANLFKIGFVNFWSKISTSLYFSCFLMNLGDIFALLF